MKYVILRLLLAISVVRAIDYIDSTHPPWYIILVDKIHPNLLTNICVNYTVADAKPLKYLVCVSLSVEYHHRIGMDIFCRFLSVPSEMILWIVVKELYREVGGVIIFELITMLLQEFMYDLTTFMQVLIHSLANFAPKDH